MQQALFHWLSEIIDFNSATLTLLKTAARQYAMHLKQHLMNARTYELPQVVHWIICVGYPGIIPLYLDYICPYKIIVMHSTET